MQRLLTYLFLVFFSFIVLAQPQRSDFKLPSQADNISWDQAKKDKITDFLSGQLTKACVVFHNDSIVYSYGNLNQAYNVFSVRKSILSLLYGIYIDKGIIDPNATLDELDIDDVQGLTDGEKQARVIDLLRARSGVYHVAAYETPGMVNNRPKREEYKPGEFWHYNNWDFNALTTIFENLTGTSVFDAFEKEVAQKNGMSFQKEIQKYHRESVSQHPATIWYFSANDLLLLGRSLLNQGKWNGSQIIPSSWVDESTQPYSDCGILGGYGYCWWASDEGFHYPFVNMPDGTFSARGTGEQNLTVIPAWNMVIVHMTEVTSPDDEMMHVTEVGKLYKIIFEQKWF